MARREIDRTASGIYCFSIVEYRMTIGGRVMQRAAVMGCKAVIVLIGVIAVLGQAVVVPLMAAEAAEAFPEVAYLRIPGIVGCVAVIACVEVALVCVWRLLSMVARESVFSPAAFRPVDVIVGCVLAATVLLVAAFAILAAARALSPGMMIMLVAGAVGGAGLTLLMVVMRGLLRKAAGLEQDLAEVI
jgi:hypothetical protein